MLCFLRLRSVESRTSALRAMIASVLSRPPANLKRLAPGCQEAYVQDLEVTSTLINDESHAPTYVYPACAGKLSWFSLPHP